MGFFRQEYWNELPFPPPGELPDPGIQFECPASSVLAGGFFTTEPPGKPEMILHMQFVKWLPFIWMLNNQQSSKYPQTNYITNKSNI